MSTDKVTITRGEYEYVCVHFLLINFSYPVSSELRRERELNYVPFSRSPFVHGLDNTGAERANVCASFCSSTLTKECGSDFRGW